MKLTEAKLKTLILESMEEDHVSMAMDLITSNARDISRLIQGLDLLSQFLKDGDKLTENQAKILTTILAIRFLSWRIETNRKKRNLQQMYYNNKPGYEEAKEAYNDFHYEVENLKTTSEEIFGEFKEEAEDYFDEETGSPATVYTFPQEDDQELYKMLLEKGYIE